MNKVYISDSNIWIDIHNAGLLDELFQLPVTLCSTDFVLDELNDLPEDQLVARGLRVETLDGDEVGKLYALKAVFNNEIVMVQKTQDGSTVRSVDEPTFATDPSALMMTVFGADDSIGKRAQEFIEDKLRQATGSPDEIADLERLIARMGSGFYRSELRTLLNAWRERNA